MQCFTQTDVNAKKATAFPVRWTDWLGKHAEFTSKQSLFTIQDLVVPTKQCGAIISISYISCLQAAHSEKSGVYKVKQGSIPKPALLCRDYPRFDMLPRFLYKHTNLVLLLSK